jgi:hypothetical protein
LFGGFGRYVWAIERNRFIEAVMGCCPEHSLTLGTLDDYFQIPASERLKAWVEHKVHLIVPVNRDFSSRIFEALITGQIPLVPDDVPDLDKVIDPDAQALLPVLRYKAGDVGAAKAAWQEGVMRFDQAGVQGVQRRHEFARDRHSLAARLADFARFIRHPGQFNLAGNGKMRFWDHWR